MNDEFSSSCVELFEIQNCKIAMVDKCISYKGTSQKLFGWKIKNGEIAVVFLRGLIVSLRSFKFIMKIANMLSLIIYPNHGTPSVLSLVVPDASIF